LCVFEGIALFKPIFIGLIPSFKENLPGVILRLRADYLYRLNVPLTPRGARLAKMRGKTQRRKSGFFGHSEKTIYGIRGATPNDRGQNRGSDAERKNDFLKLSTTVDKICTGHSQLINNLNHWATTALYNIGKSPNPLLLLSLIS